MQLNKITSETIFTRKHLAMELKKNGLPYSYPTFLKYEAEGIIPSAGNKVNYNDRAWRFYTWDEIQSIVEKVRQHVKGK